MCAVCLSPPGHLKRGIKGAAAQICSSPSPAYSPFHQDRLCGEEVSCYELCVPQSGVACPRPIAASRNELCARQCPDSAALIQPPPVVVTFPGPMLSSCPQQSVVGSSGAPAFGGSFASGGCVTSGSLSPFPYGTGAALGCGSGASVLSVLGGGCCVPSTSRRYGRLRGSCGPC